MSTNPILHVQPGRADLGAALDDPTVRGELSAQLPAWLRARRWFGGQARQLRAVEFIGWLPLPGGAVLAMIAATDADSMTTRHPLLLACDPDGAVIDGIERPALRAFLLERLLAGDTLHGHNLRCFGVPLVTDEEIDPTSSRVVGVEQSNTSIIYGDRAIMKVYRRLVAGPNPEVELGRYLTGAGFPAVPRLLATAQLVGPDGFAADLLVLQDFVPNDGDGWAWAVGAASEALTTCNSPDEVTTWLAQERATLDRAATLGATTAQLHAALAAATGSDLHPLPVTASDRAAWAATLRREADETIAALDRAGHTAPALRAAVTTAGAIPLAEVTAGGLRTRVHGDYHLGQVLRGADGWIILDFEGEPARSLAERRQHQSPLMDVAGMVRSWDYAAQSAAAARNDGAAMALAARWGATVRERFLAAYWAAANRATVPFLPPTQEDRDTLLRAFEAQKALYEVRYELNNRPDWLHIPAGAVIRLSNDE